MTETPPENTTGPDLDPVDTPPTITHWWGDFLVPEGQRTHWQIGPLLLYAERFPGEWRLGSTPGEDPLDNGVIQTNLDPAQELQGVEWRRFGYTGEDRTLHLLPMCPDRPVVSRLDQPFHLPPGEKVVLYVGAPMWLRILG